jgi:hypothetical protein
MAGARRYCGSRFQSNHGSPEPSRIRPRHPGKAACGERLPARLSSSGEQGDAAARRQVRRSRAAASRWRTHPRAHFTGEGRGGAARRSCRTRATNAARIGPTARWCLPRTGFPAPAVLSPEQRLPTWNQCRTLVETSTPSQAGKRQCTGRPCRHRLVADARAGKSPCTRKPGPRSVRQSNAGPRHASVGRVGDRALPGLPHDARRG